MNVLFDQKVMKALTDGLKGDDVKSLLSIHLQKPEKVGIFSQALYKMVINEHFQFAATWSL